MRFLKNALAATALALCAAPALAADNYTVKDSAGATITICSKDQGSGVQATCHYFVPSENHAGEIGGNATTVQTTPTVTAAAFTSGWAVGGLQTIAAAARVSGGTGLLQDVTIAFKSTQTAAQASMDIFLFSDTSLSSTCTNAAAFVLSATDFPKLIGVIHVTDTTAGNTTTLTQALNLAKTYKLAATSMYACAVTRGTPTWGTTSDLTFSYNFIRN